MSESSGDPVIETYSGRLIDPLSAAPDDICLLDIAAGLAHTCRFGGHCKRFYSVGHHSLHVSRELPGDDPRLQLLGLFHDAGEAYLGDVPRPLKAEFERLERAEERVLDAVWDAFEIDPPTRSEWERVMAADDRLLAYEAAELLEDGSWADTPPELAYELRSESIPAIREQFLSRADALLERVD